MYDEEEKENYWTEERRNPRVIISEPKPKCPECEKLMSLRKPNPNQKWLAFWGCSTYPQCKGTRDILENGRPDMFDYDHLPVDEEWLWK